MSRIRSGSPGYPFRAVGGSSQAASRDVVLRPGGGEARGFDVDNASADGNGGGVALIGQRGVSLQQRQHDGEIQQDRPRRVSHIPADIRLARLQTNAQAGQDRGQRPQLRHHRPYGPGAATGQQNERIVAIAGDRSKVRGLPHQFIHEIAVAWPDPRTIRDHQDRRAVIDQAKSSPVRHVRDHQLRRCPPGVLIRASIATSLRPVAIG